jgi:hypothetical protein
VIEGTFGFGVDSEEHMNLPKVERAHQLFQERELLKPGASFCVSHLCPHWTPVHDALAPMMEQKGITIAYDGLSLDLARGARASCLPLHVPVIRYLPTCNQQLNNLNRSPRHFEG